MLLHFFSGRAGVQGFLQSQLHHCLNESMSKLVQAALWNLIFFHLLIPQRKVKTKHTHFRKTLKSKVLKVLFLKKKKEVGAKLTVRPFGWSSGYDPRGNFRHTELWESCLPWSHPIPLHHPVPCPTHCRGHCDRNCWGHWLSGMWRIECV